MLIFITWFTRIDKGGTIAVNARSRTLKLPPVGCVFPVCAKHLRTHCILRAHSIAINEQYTPGSTHYAASN